jgi:hypothetical protein
MVAVPCVSTAPVPPPAYHRAQAKAGPALHRDALTLVTRLHLLAPCRLAMHQAGRPDLIRSPRRVLAHTWEGLLE